MRCPCNFTSGVDINFDVVVALGWGMGSYFAPPKIRVFGLCGHHNQYQNPFLVAFCVLPQVFFFLICVYYICVLGFICRFVTKTSGILT